MVMFRDFIRRYALRLDVKGFVQNLPEGSVYLQACASKENLQKLIARAKKGSLLSRVESLSIERFEPIDSCNALPKFYIKY